MDTMVGKAEDPFAELDDLDDDEFLAAMAEEDHEAAALLMEWLGDDLPQKAPQPHRRNAVEALRAGIRRGGWPYNWFAQSLTWQDGVPEDMDEEAAWLVAAGSVVSPPEDPGWDTESVVAVMGLTHADWVAAVIALVRQGAGADASPEALVRASSLVPEIEGDLDPDDVGLVEHAFEVVTPLWQALGAVDAGRRVTQMGCWGLPRALWLTWRLSGITPEGLMADTADDDSVAGVGDIDDDLALAYERASADAAEPAYRAFLDWQTAPEATDEGRACMAASALSAQGAAAWLATAVHRSQEWDPFLRWAFEAAKGTSDAAAPAMLLAVRAEWGRDPGSEEAWLAAALAADSKCHEALWRSADYAGDRGDAATAYDLLTRADVDDDDEDLATYARFRFPPAATAAPRNAQCPCGSGRKYKHCHGGQRIGYPLADRAGWLLWKVGRYLQRPPQRDLVLSYGALLAGTEDIHDPAAAHAALDQPFVTDAAMHDGAGLADFLAERGTLLPVDERELAASWLRTSRGLYEVVDVDPGHELRLRDVDDHELYDIVERIGSHEAKRGDLLLTRLLNNGSGLMLGAVMMIPRLHRASLSAALRADSAEALLAWLAASAQPPELRNTEGQALVAVTQSWRLSSVQGWRRLQQSGLVEDDAQRLLLLRPDGTLAGTFSRTSRVVEVSANSRERIEELVDRLQQVDPKAEFLSEEAASAAELMRTPRAVPEPTDSDPAMAEVLAEYVRTYEQKWIDTQIPALGGRTPRAAMRSSAFRRELELLLEDFDAMPTPAGGAGMDANRIRALLGLPQHV